MEFVTVAGAGRETDLALFSQWQWSLPTFGALMLAFALFRAATLRLVVNGYPPWIKRIFLAVMLTVLIAGTVTLAVMDPDLVRSANGWPAILSTGLGSLLASMICLAVARLLPGCKREPVVVAGLRPRRHHYKRWIPVPVTWGLLDATYQWNRGDRVMPEVVIVGSAVLALCLVVLERNYRNQRDAAGALGEGGSVLLLRTFIRDMFDWAAGPLYSWEFPVARQVRRQIGGFIALGNPHEVLPQAGADRVYLPDGAWRTQLAELADGARAILMLPDATPAVRWELGMIRERGIRQRLFIIVPAPQRWHAWLLTVPAGLVWRLSGLTLPDWSEFAEALCENGFHPPVEAPKPGSVLTFEPDGQCVDLARGLSSARELVGWIAWRLTAVEAQNRQSSPDRTREPTPTHVDGACSVSTRSDSSVAPGAGQPHVKAS
jgi:hypothetical protein